ncbi:amino acid ABC transporter permease [Humibacter antri]
MSALGHLYDSPGPKGRRRILLGSIVSAIIVLAVVVAALWQFGAHGQLDAAKWEPFAQWPIWSYMLSAYVEGTLLAAGLTAVMSAPLGVLLAVLRLSPVATVRWIATVWIEIARTFPVLLLVFVMLFALPHYGINPPIVWKLAIPLTIANSAALAEIVRAGILALPRGQTEAALALGMLRRQAFTYVVLPQALRSVTPSLVTQLVSLLKDTSLGYVLAFFELLQSGSVLASFNHLLIQDYLVVAFIYLVTNGILSYLAYRLRGWVDRRGITAVAADRPLAPVVTDH